MSSNEPDLPPPNGTSADLPPPADAGLDTEHRWFNHRVAGLPAWGLLGAAVLIWVVVVAMAIRSGGEGRSDLSFRVTNPTVASTAPPPEPVATAGASTTSPVAATTTAAPNGASGGTADRTAINLDDAVATSEAGSTPAPASSEAPVDATTEAAATTEPAADTTTPATTEPPATTAPPTTTTTVPTTTTTTTTTTTPATTTTTTPATTTAPDEPGIGISGPVTATGANGEQLTVTPRQGPCRYGPECFVASFRIEGFSYQPQEFVCEFSSGARYVFKFSSAGADPACSTLDVPDSIVVMVGSLRTEPVTIGEQLPNTP